MVEIGQPAPSFALRSHSNEEVTLDGLRDQSWIVLHTFPAAFTGG